MADLVDVDNGFTGSTGCIGNGDGERTGDWTAGGIIGFEAVEWFCLFEMEGATGAAVFIFFDLSGV